MDSLEKDSFEDDKLKYLIHYYNDDKYLFKTIMMYSKYELNKISNNIVKNKNWYWVRYRKKDRDIYYNRKCFVEKTMKNDFEKNIINYLRIYLFIFI